MTLLEEIQSAAVDSKSDLGALLRKCKLLAARLGSRPLEDWLLWEASGYPEDVNLPDYRIWSLTVKGHFSGPFGSGLRDAPIPSVHIPENIRDAFIRYKCRHSVAAIEETLRLNKSGIIQLSTGDLALALGANVYARQNCIQAWAEFSAVNLVEVLNAVRNRILDLTIAVWKEAPTAGEQPEMSGQKIESDRVTQIFNTTVYGGAANLVGRAIDSTVTINVVQNDFTSLERVLRDKGVQDEDVKSLKEALQQDGPVERESGFGPRVSTWIAAMMKKAADGSWAIGLGAAGNLLAQAISKYCGL